MLPVLPRRTTHLHARARARPGTRTQAAPAAVRARVSTMLFECSHALLLMLSCVCVGLGCAWALTALLIEVSISNAFAWYIAVTFLCVGGVLAWTGSQLRTLSNRVSTIGVSVVLLLGGVTSLFFDQNWLYSLGPFVRLPVYLILACALSLLLFFSGSEIVDYFYSLYMTWQMPLSSGQGPLPSQTPQHMMWLCMFALQIGLAVGALFAFLEVGRGVYTMHTLRAQFYYLEQCSLPVGALIGAAAGYSRHRWSHRTATCCRRWYLPHRHAVAAQRVEGD